MQGGKGARGGFHPYWPSALAAALAIALGPAEGAKANIVFFFYLKYFRTALQSVLVSLISKSPLIIIFINIVRSL